MQNQSVPVRLGDLVRSIRGEMEMSLREFGAKAGYEAMFISQIENHKSIPQKIETLNNLAKALGVSARKVRQAAEYSKIESELNKTEQKTVDRAKLALARSIAAAKLDPESIEKIMRILGGEQD